MISLCLCTRKRPKAFKTLCKSAFDLANRPDDVEIVSYHDDDDPSVYEYCGNHKEIVGPRSIGIFAMWNACQRAATGPIYMFVADDFYFMDAGWDTEVEKAFDQYPDKIVLVCPDGGYWRTWKFGVIGFVHKEWVDAVGYLFPEYSFSGNVDRWVNELAVMLDRRVRLSTRVEHSLIRDDDTHKEKNRQGKLNEWTKKFMSPEAVEQREKDMLKLKAKMLLF